MRLYALLLLSLVSTGCISVPSSVEVYEKDKMIIAKTIKLHNQTLYVDTPLTKYRVNGRLAYCINTVDMNYSLTRCFAIENGYMTDALNPISSKWVNKSYKIPFKKAE